MVVWMSGQYHYWQPRSSMGVQPWDTKVMLWTNVVPEPATAAFAGLVTTTAILRRRRPAR
ncbi:MAG TPA: PEP-CTERM sorting domain-containing protein [Tepidisphaeraceae bacterium]|nr:PEP-CTERM sorting domain-containing protein [Tepidisphaeraceae bacterium]